MTLCGSCLFPKEISPRPGTAALTPSRARDFELADAEAASGTAAAVAFVVAAVAIDAAAAAAIVVEAAVVAVDTYWAELSSNCIRHEVEARLSADRVCNCSPLRRTSQLQLQS